MTVTGGSKKPTIEAKVSPRMLKFSLVAPLERPVDAEVIPAKGDPHHRGAKAAAAAQSEVVNNEYCSACRGKGALICCESCPKSYHFTCIDPPIDEDAIPQENWYCTSCDSARTAKASASPHVPPAQASSPALRGDAAAGSGGSEATSSAPPRNVSEIWRKVNKRVSSAEPRAFSLPKRFRQTLSAEEATLAVECEKRPLADVLPPHQRAPAEGAMVAPGPGEPSPAVALLHHPQYDRYPAHLAMDYRDQLSQMLANGTARHSPQAAGPSEPVRVGGRERTTSEGYCHCCNQPAAAPMKPLLCCDRCALLWHLDCLPYALAVPPSPTRIWSCPLHMDESNLSRVIWDEHALQRALYASSVGAGGNIALSHWNVAPSIVGHGWGGLATGDGLLSRHVDILPEQAIRFNFGWKAKQCRRQAQSGGGSAAAGFCHVPCDVRAIYEAVRSEGHRSRCMR